jgi:hypothetical protein
VTAAAAPILVAVSSVFDFVEAQAWAAGAACCAPTIGAAAALPLIADVATTVGPAAAAAFPARGPIGAFAAGSARVFPALSSAALPPTSVTVGAASSIAALTVGVVAAPPTVAASRWMAVLGAESVSLGPGGLRLVLAALRARSSAVSASQSLDLLRRFVACLRPWVPGCARPCWPGLRPSLGLVVRLAPVVWAGCRPVVVGV